MSKQIKIIDPGIAKREEETKRDVESEQVRRQANPTEKDKLESNTTKQLLKDDEVTREMKQKQTEVIRYYKFRHPDKEIMLYGSKLKGESLSADELKWGATWISPEEYHSATNEHYEASKGKGKPGLLNTILDIEVVRGNPEFEKIIKRRW